MDDRDGDGAVLAEVLDLGRFRALLDARGLVVVSMVKFDLGLTEVALSPVVRRDAQYNSLWTK